MTDFQREERYIVVKLKDIGQTRLGALRQFLEVKEIPTRECVVVEPDWPIYEETWENVQRVAEGQPSIREELSKKTDLCTRQRDLEAKLQGEINDLEDALRDALDLAGDVDWFVRMQGGSDPGMKQVVEKAKAFIAEYSTQQIRPSHGREDARNEADDIAANAQWMADIIRSHLSHLPEAREALDASPGTSLDRLKEERDALAAHLQYIQAVREKSKSDDPFTAMSGFSALDSAMRNTPTTSLACRDARERLAELSAIFELPYDVDVIGHINERCSVLRTTIEQKDPL